MSYTTYLTQHHVKFHDELDDDYVRSATPTVQMESNKSAFAGAGAGPHFPNLQMMFKNRSTDSYNEDNNVFGYHRSSAPTSPANGGGRGLAARKKQDKQGVEEEDVNTEASEFIKRKHHNLQLQKLMSTKLVV